MKPVFSDIENRLYQQIEAKGGRAYHDYGNPMHYEYALSRLGGKDLVRKSHPVVFKTLEKAKADHLAAANAAPAQAAAPDDGFSDSNKVRAIYFDDKSVISDVSADHKETRPSLAITAKIVDTTNQQIVATSQEYGDEIFKLFAEMKKKTSELVHSDDRVFKTVADFWWLDDTKNGVATQGYTQVFDDFKVIGRNSIVTDFVVNGPISVNDPARNVAAVVYNRKPGTGKDWDYWYDNSPHNNKVDIYMPASATVTLTKDWKIQGLNRDMGYQLQIEDLNKGVVNYYGSGGFDSIQTQINGNVITFTFQDNRYPADPKKKEFWNNALDISNFNVKTTVNIYCQVELNIINTKGLEIHIPVVFQSKNPPSGDKSIATSKPISIQWGCVGKDTQILLSDMTTKPISRVVVGDIVVNEKGEEMSVVNVYSGQEKTITLLKTEKGKQVLATDGHPVSTKRGVIPFAALTAADMIQTSDGYEAITDLRTVDYNDKAYSLSFADPHLLPCNGIILGDFGTQQLVGVPLAANSMAAGRSRECNNAKAEFKDLISRVDKSA